MARILRWDLDKTIAPLLLGFIPFLFLGGKRNPTTRFLLVLGALLLVSGFLISHQLRLMIPAFAVSFLAMAMVLGETGKKWAAPAWGGVVLLFGLLSLLSLGRLSVNYYQSQKMWFGSETREEYLMTVPPTASYDALASAVGFLAPLDARVLVVGDARGLYYPRLSYTNSVFDEQPLAKLAGAQKDGRGIWKKLREKGIDLLAVSGEEGHRLAGQYPFYGFKPEDERKLDDLIQHWTDPLFFQGLNGIYRLRSSPAKPRKPVPDLLKLLQANS